MTEIAIVSIPDGLAYTEDGQELPITNSFDDCGDDCDLEDAVVVVAGPDADGMFLTIDLRELSEVTLH